MLPAPLYDLFFDHTARTVALGAGTLGAVSGALGSFAVLRRQSLLGDAVSHAALPGIALAFLLTASRAPLVLLAGAAVAGWLATLSVTAIVRASRVKPDVALGVVLSVFFGFGLVLLTYLQRNVPDASQAGLDHYLFGQAATILLGDLSTILVLGAVAVVVLLLLWKEFKLLTFDPDFAATLGLPVRRLDVLLTTLLVVAIVIGLQTVGVVLMSAMIVAPAAAARQWTDRLGVMVGLAGLLGAAAGVSGAVLSGSAERLPTGPTIVLCAAALVVLSLFLAPGRGLLWEAVRQWRNRRELHLDAVLADLYELARQHPDAEHAHPTAVLRATRGPGVERSLASLAERGWARRVGPDGWCLTDEGRREARTVVEQAGGQTP
jgi:manganese/zinc/iron transport system permease protein